MKDKGHLLGLLLLILLEGCSPGPKRGTVSGTVTDAEGNPVVNAEVYVEDKGFASTRTLPNGTYYLTGVPEGFILIRARALINQVEYTGQQVAQIFEKEQSKSVNLMVAPVSQQGGLAGYVRGPSGEGVEGARVFVSGALSSALAVTDKNGFYQIEGLPAGYRYSVVASMPGFDNDAREQVEIVAGQIIPFSFSLNFSTNKPVNAPQNLRAIAWTLPPEVVKTRSRRLAQAYGSIMHLLQPHRKAHSRATRQSVDHFIEIDLEWDYEKQISLLGYGIFRGTSRTEPLTNAIAFLRDPLASFFADLDLSLQPETTYYYEIAALNTDYLNDPTPPGSISDRSNRASAKALLPLMVISPPPGSIVSRKPTFNWQGIPRADFYQVLVYDRFPNYQVNPYYPSDPENPGETKVPAPQTFLLYNGLPLSPGKTYYLVVIAFTKDKSSRSISPIVPFQVR